MIKFYPVESETLVLSHDWDVVMGRLSLAMDKPFIKEGIPRVIEGWVRDDTFQISIRIRRQQFFMPQIKGTIEPTSKGSLVFITYSFFPGTKALLTFWTVILPLISIPLVFEYDNPWIMAGMFAFTILMHVVARQNFRLHSRMAREIVHDLLN